jgi:hypothetical protein
MGVPAKIVKYADECRELAQEVSNPLNR